MFGRRVSREPVAAEGDPAYGDTTVEPRRRRAVPTRRRGVGRGRTAGAAAVGTVGAGIVGLARLVMLVTTLIVALIVLAIVLRDLDANAGNSLVKAIHDAANFFAKPFNDVFTEKGHVKRQITLNWGIAAVVYLLVGSLIARLIGRVGRGGIATSRRAAAV